MKKFVYLFLLLSFFSLPNVHLSFAQDENETIVLKRLVQQHESEINMLKSSLNNIDRKSSDAKIISEMVKESMSFYITVITYITAAVLGIATIIFGILTFYLMRENSNFKEQAASELALLELQLEKLQGKYEAWLSEEESKYKTNLNNISETYQDNIIQLNHYFTLLNLINKEDISADEIYTNLTPLIVDPKFLYKSIFQKIIKLNINDAINIKAQEGLGIPPINCAIRS